MSDINHRRQRTRREARRLKALQLTVAGGSSRAVAEQLEREGYGKVSHTTVLKDLRSALESMALEARGQVENQRALMNERYKRLFLSWWGVATSRPPDREASNKVLSIIKAIRELNGLDVAIAQRLEHTGDVSIGVKPDLSTLTDDDIAALRSLVSEGRQTP